MATVLLALVSGETAVLLCRLSHWIENLEQVIKFLGEQKNKSEARLLRPTTPRRAAPSSPPLQSPPLPRPESRGLSLPHSCRRSARRPRTEWLRSWSGDATTCTRAELRAPCVRCSNERHLAPPWRTRFHSKIRSPDPSGQPSPSGRRDLTHGASPNVFCFVTVLYPCDFRISRQRICQTRLHARSIVYKLPCRPSCNL